MSKHGHHADVPKIGPAHTVLIGHVSICASQNSHNRRQDACTRPASAQGGISEALPASCVEDGAVCSPRYMPPSAEARGPGTSIWAAGATKRTASVPGLPHCQRQSSWSRVGSPGGGCEVRCLAPRRHSKLLQPTTKRQPSEKVAKGSEIGISSKTRKWQKAHEMMLDTTRQQGTAGHNQ